MIGQTLPEFDENEEKTGEPLIDPEPDLNPLMNEEVDDEIPAVVSDSEEMGDVEVPEIESFDEERAAQKTVADVESGNEMLPANNQWQAPVSQETSLAQMPSLTTLLKHEDQENFRTQWNAIQGKFVDDPRAAVTLADELVCKVMDQISQVVTLAQSSLESQWRMGSDVSTETLRKTLQQYREFFNRLLV